MARYDMVERQVGGLRSAVLAGVLVADEDLAPAEPDARSRSLDPMLKPDDARRPEDGRGRSDVVVVVLDDLGLLCEDEAEGAPDVAHVQRLVIGIQQQYCAIHDSLRPAGTR